MLAVGSNLFGAGPLVDYKLIEIFIQRWFVKISLQRSTKNMLPRQ